MGHVDDSGEIERCILSLMNELTSLEASSPSEASRAALVRSILGLLEHLLELGGGALPPHKLEALRMVLRREAGPEN